MYALYLRVSSEEQAKYGYSLDAQEDALISYCTSNKIASYKIYRDEGHSARQPYNKREKMMELLSDVQSGIVTSILFYKLDRWFRNVKEYYKVQEILDAHKCTWKSISEDYETETANGRLTVNIMLSVAENEADRTSERIKFVNANKVARGEVVSGTVPYGYKISVVDGKKRLIKDETKSDYINDMFRFYLDTLSVSRTAEKLNRKYGTNYAQRTVQRRLLHPIYCGIYKNNKSFCEPYISVETHGKILDISNSVRNKNNIRRRIFLFSSLLRCPICGSKMGGHFRTAPYKLSDPYRYRCNHYWDRSLRCTYNRTFAEHFVEDLLIGELSSMTDETITAEIAPNQPNIGRLNEEKRKLESMLSRAKKLFVIGDITETEYNNIKSDVQNKIARLRPPQEKREVLKLVSTPWLDVYNMLDREHKRTFWQTIVKSVVYDADTHEIKVEWR